MLSIRRAPVPALAAHVDELWYFGDAPPHRSARLLPAGTLELVFELDDDHIRIRQGGRVRRLAGAVVSGAYRSAFATETRDRSTRIGVHFRAGAAWPFLGAPPGELADRHVELAALWGPSAAELRERLCEAATPELRLDLLEHALLARLAHRRAVHPGVPFAITALATGVVRIADVAGELGISHRRLVDVFTAAAGLGPKTFARIARFRHALARARRERTPDWARLAHAFGYYDQSHLIREFVAITGDSPSVLLARSTGNVREDHVVAGDFQFVQDLAVARR